MTDDDAEPRNEPMPVRAEDASVSSRRLFAFNPVLAVHEGPWELRRSPVAGTLLILAGILVLFAAVVGLIIDRIDETPRLGGGEILGVGTLVLFSVAALIAAGRALIGGRPRHAPTGRKLIEERVNLCGTPELGARIHAGLRDGTLTTGEDLRSGQRRGGWKIDLFVRFYEVPKTPLAYATVHFVAEDDVLVWPPLEISTELATALTLERFSAPTTNYLD